VRTQCATSHDQLDYQQRRPERSTLYQVVAQHVQTLFAEAEQHGAGYPTHVKREFERYLRCGQLQRGFARVRCSGCGFERLVPYSCKGRSLCPSCVARRMADTAAHLVDHVLPVAPYRLWTLSLPRSIRVRVVREPALLTKVLSIFLRTVFAYQRRRARALGIANPQTGAVSFVQLWGSVLQLTPHAHSWLPDGVFAEDGQGALRLHRLPPPSDEDVEALLARIVGRVFALFDDDDADDGADEDDPQLWAQAEATQPLLFSIPLTADVLKLERRRCAFIDGYSLHADLDVAVGARKKLERLLRYALRPPFAARRLSQTHDGKVRLELRKPWHTGQRDIIFEPVAFLRRLAAAIPRPRQNLTRFHGIFAANAKLRPALRTLVPPPAPAPSSTPLSLAPGDGDNPARTNPPDATAKPDPTGQGCPHQPPVVSLTDEPEQTPIRYRRPWAQLLARIFHLTIDYTRYLVCGDAGPHHPPVPSAVWQDVRASRRTGEPAWRSNLVRSARWLRSDDCACMD
jgi:hypothetical protein